MAGAVTVVTVFTVVDTGRVEAVDEGEGLPAGVVDTDRVELVDDGKVLPADVAVEFENGREVEVLELVGTTDVWLAAVAVDVAVTLDLNCGTELTAPETKAGPGTGYAVKAV